MVCRHYLNEKATDKYYEIDLDKLNNYEGIHELYNAQKRRKIHKSNFDDDCWLITNQYDSVKIDFKKLNPKYKEYIYMIKLFTVLLIDTKINKSVKAEIDFIIDIINRTNFFNVSILQLSEQESSILTEFWDLIDFNAENIKVFTDIQKQNSKQRKLCSSFDSYYIFDEEMTKFWQRASDEEKIIYGPLKIYWDLCNILPTRPKAFVLMPKDCIKELDGEYYLIMRSSIIKGSGRKPQNNIFLDYPTRERCVNKQMAETIIEYRYLVEDTLNEDDDYLFNNEYYNRLRPERIERQRTFKVTHLSKLMKSFYAEVISKKYEVRELEVNELLEPSGNTVEKMCLGDLRHLSMISMIFLGVDPSVIMDLADHSDISASCHYFSNAAGLKNTYLEYLRGSGKEKNVEQRFKMSPIIDSNISIVDGGRCMCSPEDRAKYCSQYVDHTKCKFFVATDKEKIFEQNIRIDIEINAAIRSLQNSIQDKEAMRDALKKIQDNLEQSRRLAILCRHMQDIQT